MNVERKVNLVYPAVGTLPTTYATTASVMVSDDEVIIDFAVVEPQTTREDNMDAAVVSRLILSHGHARKIAEAISKTLKERGKGGA